MHRGMSALAGGAGPMFSGQDKPRTSSSRDWENPLRLSASAPRALGIIASRWLAHGFAQDSLVCSRVRLESHSAIAPYTESQLVSGRGRVERLSQGDHLTAATLNIPFYCNGLRHCAGRIGALMVVLTKRPNSRQPRSHGRCHNEQAVAGSVG